MEIYTVSQINAIIKNYIENDEFFKYVCIEGEVSNITYQLKHMYMSIKDTSSKIRCACFSYKYNNIPLDLKEGDKIKVYGAINVYSYDATVQIIAKKVEKKNSIGELYQKLEELKKKYQMKGYFLESNKKSLPKYPRIIGVVTSDTGDAIQDIIRNVHNRDEKVEIYLYPAKVQGIGAKKTIVKGIEFFNKHPELGVECLIIGRGGGSIEDLWSFNTEEVVEAIYASALPIISAVGHEADVLLSDLVADVRASTPTHSAHCLIPIRKEIEDQFMQYREKMKNLLNKKIELMKTKLEYIKDKLNYDKFYKNVILEKYQKLDYINEKLDNNIKLKLKDKKNILLNKANLLEKYNIDNIFDRGFTISYIDDTLIKDVNITKGKLMKTISKDKTILSEVK